MVRIMNWWRRFWMPPDTSLLQTGGQGEILISWFRLGISVAAIAVAYFASRQVGPTTPAQVYLIVTVIALPVAGSIHIFVSRATYGWWIGFVTSILDVTFVSSTLAVFLFLGQTDLALLNPVAFPVYFLALAATSMRLDHRACAVAGGLSVLQYGSLVEISAHAPTAVLLPWLRRSTHSSMVSPHSTMPSPSPALSPSMSSSTT